MKRVLSALAVIPLLAACSGAPATSTPASTPPASAVATPAPTTVKPTPTKTARSFSAAELALIQASGRSTTDSNIDEFIESAHNVCDTVKPLSDEAVLMSLQQVDAEARKRAGQIMIFLCEQERLMSVVVAAEVGGFASGTYYVGDGENEIKPGKYKTAGAAQNCYWVRKDANGEIIDNELVANAPGGVRMTVRASDHEVTLQGCGIWIPDA